MILIDAIYTNHSGSMRLLEYFITYSLKKGLLKNYFFLFDRRLESESLSLVPSDQRLFLEPTESQRRRYYKLLPATVTSVFCFGSVPPPVKIKDRHVVILQHNPFFFENPGYTIRFKLTYLLKRLYIWNRTYKKYDWVVQTQRIKDLLIKSIGLQGERIVINPFFEMNSYDPNQAQSTSANLRFIYPADGVPQKNHEYLFKVWERLYTESGLLPELHVTLPPKYARHIEKIKRLQRMGLKIVNHGFVSKAEMKTLYSQSQFLVFPSFSESFGLPLAEGAAAGLKVIGSDLPYLYQIIEPSAVFNPKDVKSLSNLIISIHEGVTLKGTKILIRDKISELIELIHKS